MKVNVYRPNWPLDPSYIFNAFIKMKIHRSENIKLTFCKSIIFSKDKKYKTSIFIIGSKFKWNIIKIKKIIVL